MGSVERLRRWSGRFRDPPSDDMGFMRRQLATLGAVALAGYLGVLRHRLRYWGSTEEEAARQLPGDDLIPDARGGATMATTINAPPDAIWPWLIQMGCDRAGWYSWDRLDNAGRPSADRIVPEWQQIAVGDRLASTPDERFWFDVARLDPGRALVLRASIDIAGRHSIDPDDPLPPLSSDSTWGFHLEGQGPDSTRLLVRGFDRGRPGWLTAAVNIIFWEPAHAVMQRRQIHNLSRRTEAQS